MMRKYFTITRWFISLSILFFGNRVTAQENNDSLFFAIETNLNLMQNKSADILCPEEYGEAVEYYFTARKYEKSQKSVNAIIKELELSSALITKMNNTVEERTKVFGSILQAREEAIKAHSKKYATEYWDSAEEKFQDCLKDYLDYDTTSLQKTIPLIIKDYQNAKDYSDYAHNLIFKWVPLQNADKLLANLLSSDRYLEAQEKIDDAVQYLAAGKGMNRIQVTVDEAAVLLKKATEISQKFTDQYPQLINDRTDAAVAGAEIHSADLWNEAEENLQEAALNFEKDKTEKTKTFTREAEQKYLTAKHLSQRITLLSRADELILLAEKEDAQNYAEKYFNEAKSLIKTMTEIIESDTCKYDKLKTFAELTEQNIVLSREITQTIKDAEKRKDKWAALVLCWKDTIKVIYNKLKTKKINDVQVYEDETTFDPVKIKNLKDGNEIIVRLMGLQFLLLGSSLDDEGRLAVMNAISVLKLFTSLSISIVGFANDAVDSTINKELSQKTTENIRDYILSHSKFDSSLITATGFGVEKSIANDKSINGREQRRRIEIIIK